MILSNPLPSLKNPTISQWYGENKTGFYVQLGMKGHSGIDFPAPLGTSIVSMADGEVLEAVGKDTGFGIRVSLWHQISEDTAYLTVYGHMKKTAFPDYPWAWTPYESVKCGQIIGYADSTGMSTGNHLHISLYEYRIINNSWVKSYNDNGYFGAINPISFLSINPMVKILKDKDSPTIYVAYPVDEPKNLIWLAKQSGRQIPEKNDGSPDWDNIAYDGFVIPPS